MNETKIGERSNVTEIAPLTEPKVVAVLSYLSDRVGEVIERAEIIDAVWGQVGSDEALTQSISKARRLLREYGLEQVLETVPRKGYILHERLAFIEGPKVLSPEKAVPAGGGRDTLATEMRLLQQENTYLKASNKKLKLGLIAIFAALALLLIWTVYQKSGTTKIIKVPEGGSSKQLSISLDQ